MFVIWPSLVHRLGNTFVFYKFQEDTTWWTITKPCQEETIPGHNEATKKAGKIFIGGGWAQPRESLKGRITYGMI